MSAPYSEGNGHHREPTPAEKMRAKVEETKQQAESVAEAVTSGITDKVIENPYGMLAAAFAVGYVVGGGLFTKTTARVVQLGARLAMIPQVREPLLDLAEQALDGILQNKGTPQDT
ncbi:MAG: hypothetical protein JNK82_25115 [Myxococcaceae bacterium]|nr:hypothetical protein [Myxococcaceae bacterium]